MPAPGRVVSKGKTALRSGWRRATQHLVVVTGFATGLGSRPRAGSTSPGPLALAPHKSQIDSAWQRPEPLTMALQVGHSSTCSPIPPPATQGVSLDQLPEARAQSSSQRGSAGQTVTQLLAPGLGHGAQENQPTRTTTETPPVQPSHPDSFLRTRLQSRPTLASFSHRRAACLATYRVSSASVSFMQTEAHSPQTSTTPLHDPGKRAANRMSPATPMARPTIHGHAVTVEAGEDSGQLQRLFRQRPTQFKIWPGLDALPPFHPVMPLQPPAKQTSQAGSLPGRIAVTPTLKPIDSALARRIGAVGQSGSLPSGLQRKCSLLTEELPERKLLGSQGPRLTQRLVKIAQNGNQLRVDNELPPGKTNCPDERTPVWAKVDRLKSRSMVDVTD